MAIEPLYSLDVAAELIPCTKHVLNHILTRRASELDEPLFHTCLDNGPGKQGHLVRMLRESECLKIRDMVIKRGGPHGRGARGERNLTYPNRAMGVQFG